MPNGWTVGLVGDVFVDRDQPCSAFSTVKACFDDLGVVIGNCEGAYTDFDDVAPTAHWRVVGETGLAEAFAAAGFDVLTCANNHTMDAGHRGLLQTLETLRGLGIATVGAGRNLAEARRHVAVEHDGVRIAVTAHSSVYHPGYGAHGDVPGIATVRIHSHYYIPDWDAHGRIEPGVRPHVRTFAYPEDIAALRQDIAAARAAADIVVSTFHWGESSRRGLLTDYEREVAHAAIDAGADLVVGHHHHFLRGIEFHKGRPIFYGLGHFVFDLKWIGEQLSDGEIAKLQEAYGAYAIYPRDGYPLLPFHPDGRFTMIALARLENRMVVGAGFIPCLIDPRNRAVPLQPGTGEWDMFMAYMNQITDDARLDTIYEVRTDQVGGAAIVEAKPLQPINFTDDFAAHCGK